VERTSWVPSSALLAAFVIHVLLNEMDKRPCAVHKLDHSVRLAMGRIPFFLQKLEISRFSAKHTFMNSISSRLQADPILEFLFITIGRRLLHSGKYNCKYREGEVW
jgi:hypothetical protein